MMNPTIKFSRVDSAKFFKTLNKRVNTYFKENEIKKTGNWKLYTKTIVMFTLFLAPMILILTLNLPTWLQLVFVVIIGIG
ncbi:MAG: acyl-CoA desaturase, partial [Kordia sp.]